MLCVLTACHVATPVAEVAVFGTIIAANSNQPVKGAHVTAVNVGAGSGAVTSDERGAFTVSVPGNPNAYVAVTVEMPGYSPVTRRVQVFKKASFLPVRLAPVDVSYSFAAPPTGQTVTIDVGHGGATSQLRIPGNSLIKPDGSFASGTLTANLTFFSPSEDLTLAPALLRYADSDGSTNDALPKYLRSYGMLDIDMRNSDGEHLQVAPGQSLALDMTTTEALRLAYLGNPNSSGPTLWTLNPNTALWQEDVGASTYDPNTGTMHATLYHLSSKNMDEPMPFGVSPPGCVTGRVVGSCGNPIAGASVTITMNSRFYDGTLYTFTATSDINGNYAIDQVPSTHIEYYAVAQYGAYTSDSSKSPLPTGMLTGPSNFYDSAVPLPGVQALGGPQIPGAVIGCSTSSGTCPSAACSCYADFSDNTCLAAYDNDARTTCWIDPLGFWPAGTDQAGNPCYDDYVGPLLANMNYVWKGKTVGTLCQNCWPLLDMVLPIAGDSSASCTTNCCQTAAQSTICGDPKNPLFRAEGDACNPGGPDLCCPATALSCLDYVCVPNLEPEAQ